MKRFAILWFCCVAAHADVVLVKDGQAPLTIYTAAQPAPQERTAATELAKYLEKRSGTKFTVQPAPATVPDTGIFVGALDEKPDAELSRDAFRIEAKGQTLRLRGSNPLATEWAVFALLEEQFGCRWWTYNEEDVPPARATLSVAEMNQVTRPGMAIHNVWNREAQNPVNQFVAKARTTSSTSFTGSHTMYPLLKDYGATHPEIYPEKDGKRAPNNLHFCYAAPGIAEALADALGKVVEAKNRNTRDVIYFAGMGDWYGGMCECEKCQAIYEEETWTDPDGRKKPGVTATLLRMINRTAEILDQRYPGIRIGTFAYMSLEAPPAKTVPRENVVIRVPRLRHCTVHPARTCEKNASFARNIERWGEIAPGRVYIWEYATSFTHFLNPFPCLYSMADNLKFYHEHGVSGVEIQGNYVTNGGDLAAMKNYVWRKVFWRPDLDPRAVLTEFCQGYYGAAAGDMMAYVDVLEKSVVAPEPRHADEFSQPSYLTPEIRADMARHRDAALTHAQGNETVQRRIREATMGLESSLLWKPATLVEAGDQLVRKEIGSDSLERVREMLKYTRGAGPNEFQSNTTSYLTAQIFQGGPLVTLEHNGLQVKLAPLINGQLRQITWQGKGLLYVASNPGAKGFPMIGGSLDGVGVKLMEVEGKASPTKVRIASGREPAYNSGPPRQKIGKEVELAEDGSISITMDAQRMVKAAADPHTAAVSTAYAVGRKLADARLEIQTEGDQWHTLELSGDQTEWPLPKLVALRVRLPEQACTVIDRYVFPQVTGGKVVVNAKDGTLTTTVNTAEVQTPVSGPVKFLERRIQVQP